MHQTDLYDEAIQLAKSIYSEHFFNQDPLLYRSDAMIATLLVENNIHLDEHPFKAGSFCGMLIIDELETTIVYNKNHPVNRRNFTIAHELGHFFLHRNIQSKFIDRPKSLSDYIDSDIEKQANVFASELLIPQKVLVSMLINRFNFYRIGKITRASYECTKWRLVRHLMTHYGLSRNESLYLVEDYKQMSNMKLHRYSKIFDVLFYNSNFSLMEVK